MRLLSEDGVWYRKIASAAVSHFVLSDPERQAQQKKQVFQNWCLEHGDK